MIINNNILIHDCGPFWDLIKSYQLCWYGIALVFKTGECNLDKGKPILSLGCKASDKIFFQHHEEIIKLRSETNSQEMMYELDCMLVNLAFERVKQLNDYSPEFEFFRHIRNAASHKNEFNFIKIEPKRPASWLNLSIDHTLKGSNNPLFGQPCFGSFIGSGDLFFLLETIESKILSRWLVNHPSR